MGRRSRRDDYYDDGYNTNSRRRRNGNSRRSNRSNNSGYGSRRKSMAEARVERITWMLLVGVFALLYLTQDSSFAENLPNWFAPVAGALILLGSGFYQYAQRWRVSPATWIGGALMLATAYYGLYMNPLQDLTGFCLLVFAAVIGFGVITGET